VATLPIDDSRVQHTLWAYPWDILDDEAAPDEIAALGLGAVSLAASYHTTRAISPHDPRRAVVSARHAAVYFRPDLKRYAGIRLQPAEPSWVASDSFRIAADALRAVGQRVIAWVVLLHNSRLGEANPDLTIENAFGDLYTYALCPAQPEVRAYAAALVSDLVSRYALDGIELEACGYMGVEHLSHHDKSGMQLDLLHRFLFSICFCPACRLAMLEVQVDSERVRASVAAALRRYFEGTLTAIDDPEQVDVRLMELLGHDAWAGLMQARNGVTLRLLDAVKREIGRRSIEVTLAAGSSAYDTGAAVGAALDGLTTRADGLLLPLFGMSDARAQAHVRRMVQGTAGKARLTVGLRAFMPDTNAGDQLRQVTRRLVGIGVGGFRYYHYGLCPRPNLRWIADAARPDMA
jgi:hypothetical protein